MRRFRLGLSRFSQLLPSFDLAPDWRCVTYSESPAASRASLGSMYPRIEIALPFLNSVTNPIGDSTSAPLALPRARVRPIATS
jgi:hypothetical protein